MTKKGGLIDYNVPLRLPIPGEDTEAMFRRLVAFSYAVGRQYRADGGPAEEPGAEASRFVREELARPSEVEQAQIREITRPSPLLDQYAGYGSREAVKQNVSRPMPTAHEFVQHQLRGNEPQLPQMDREAYQRMKEYSVFPLELAAYEIPVAGQALAAVDLARSIGGLGSALGKGDKEEVAGSAAEAGMAASGTRGKLAKAAAAVMAGLMPEEAEAGTVGKALRAIRAYHGSPHKFDKFDISKIGTGEGAQAYGHGLYFAESEPVAKGYRDSLAHKGAIDLEREASLRGLPLSRDAQIELMRQSRAVEDPVRAAKQLQWANAETRGMDLDALADLIKARQDSIKGHMYEVDIHANPEHLLDWDRPLSEQPYVLQQLLSEGKRHKNTVNDLISQRDAIAAKAPDIQATGDDFADLFAGSDWRGWNEISKINQEIDAAKIAEKNAAAKGALYSGDFNKSALLSTPGRGLARSNNLNAYDFLGVENDRELSGILHNAGIPGIKYLDAGSRGAGGGSRNYVIFDDNLIDILRRYAQGGEVEREDYGKGGAIGRAIEIAREMMKRAPESGKMGAFHALDRGHLPQLKELGAIPAPSIAITRPDLVPTSFGDTLLVGKPHLAVPSEQNRVFGADVYSPSFPKTYTDVEGKKYIGAPGSKDRIPLTVENIIASMSERPLRGGEKSASDYVGRLLGNVAPEYRSAEEMLAGRGRLVDDIEEHNEMIGDLGSRILGHGMLLGKYHKNPESNDPKGQFTSALNTYLERGMPGFSEHYNEPERAMSNIQDALNAARSVRPDYFEAKPMRPVSFNEFAGALVGRDKAGTQAAEHLENMGFPSSVIHRSDIENPGERAYDIYRKFGEHLFAGGGPVNSDALDVISKLPQAAE